MRDSLPNRRQVESFQFIHNGIKHHASFSKYEDGRVAEVFLDAHKPGSAIQAFAQDGALAVSLALQFGCPIETLRHAMTRGENGEAAGPLGQLLDMVLKQ